MPPNAVWYTGPAAFSFIVMESVLDICGNPCDDGHVKLAFHPDKEVSALKNRLEEIRKQHDILQEELAEAMEVSRQTISSLENGRYNPSIILAIKIARYFKMSVEEIFIYEEEAK